jgi:hypothetical protein
MSARNRSQAARADTSADTGEASSDIGTHAQVLGGKESSGGEAEGFQIVVIGSEVDSSAVPVLGAKPRDADHVAEVCRDERRIDSKGMCRNRGITILNPASTTFQ